MSEEPTSYQVGGSHYRDCEIQPINYIISNELGFCEGNIVKYITRWRTKGGVDDLRKIKQYVDFLIKDAEIVYPQTLGTLSDRNTAFPGEEL